MAGELGALQAGEPWVACNTCVLKDGKELLLGEGKRAYSLSPEKGKAFSKKRKASAPTVPSRELPAAHGLRDASSTLAL